MKNYSNWKNENSGSAILEALNKGNGSDVRSFTSVNDFISGLLGPNFNPNTLPNKEISQEKESVKNTPTENKEEEIETIRFGTEETENEEEIEKEEIQKDTQTDESFYKIYRDKEENFECNISIQGAKISNSQARLVLDHEICNLVFYGKVSKDGKCLVPLKKMTFLPEGSIGRIRLEVIVDDTIFIPWEETFVVEGAKKVTVQIKPQKKVDFSF
jgi:hypothetical protein